jgi:hypothetical protein
MRDRDLFHFTATLGPFLCGAISDKHTAVNLSNPKGTLLRYLLHYVGGEKKTNHVSEE